MGKISCKQLPIAALLLTGVLLLTAGCDLIKPGKSTIEKESVSVVNDMLKKNDLKFTCLSVKIIQELGNDRYKATASTTLGRQIGVIIKVSGKMIEVKLDFEDQNSVMLFAETLINRNLKDGVSCTRLGNMRKIGDGEYLATAFLSNGDSGKVKITVSGDYVQIRPAQDDED